MIPAADFAPGTIFGGRYRIVSLLGRGGLGEVYRAEDLTVDYLEAGHLHSSLTGLTVVADLSSELVRLKPQSGRGDG